MSMNTVFAGNPGAGKSTLLNSLMGSRHFHSGVSYGKGLTYRMDKHTIGNQTFMDTPGLADQALRKQAGEAIEQALKQGGIYRVVFVITLEAGRVRPEDSTTIQTVLRAGSTIGNNYAIIINKIVPKSLDGLKRNLEKVKAMLFRTDGVPATDYVFLNTADDALADNQNALKPASADFKAFLDTMPTINIAPAVVKKIDTRSWEERSHDAQLRMAALERDAVAMEAEMERNRLKYRRQREAAQAAVEQKEVEKEVAGVWVNAGVNLAQEGVEYAVARYAAGEAVEAGATTAVRCAGTEVVEAGATRAATSATTTAALSGWASFGVGVACMAGELGGRKIGEGIGNQAGLTGVQKEFTRETAGLGGSAGTGAAVGACIAGPPGAAAGAGIGALSFCIGKVVSHTIDLVTDDRHNLPPSSEWFPRCNGSCKGRTKNLGCAKCGKAFCLQCYTVHKANPCGA